MEDASAILSVEINASGPVGVVAPVPPELELGVAPDGPALGTALVGTAPVVPVTGLFWPLKTSNSNSE
ncbi:MAG: hypothetical protein QOE61_3892 [Micromonosporaceae bacterium]|jgi:hypothetical protein|nr:hypothetical protein [Micromonosporaceae bacterium]